MKTYYREHKEGETLKDFMSYVMYGIYKVLGEWKTREGIFQFVEEGKDKSLWDRIKQDGGIYFYTEDLLIDVVYPKHVKIESYQEVVNLEKYHNKEKISEMIDVEEKEDISEKEEVGMIMIFKNNKMVASKAIYTEEEDVSEYVTNAEKAYNIKKDELRVQRSLNKNTFDEVNKRALRRR